MIDLIVYDKNIEPVGIVDTESELLWERRFYEAGYFEMIVPPTENNNALLQTGNILVRAETPEAGRILYLGKNTDTSGNATVTVIGRFLSYVLHGHIVRGIQTRSGNAEAIMRDLVESVCIDGADADIIPGLVLGAECGATAEISIRLEYNDLHDALKEIARLSGVGFRIRLDPNTKNFIFECINGIDRTANQYENPQVIFSPDYDTIVGEVSSTEDDSTLVNAVTMRYSGEFGDVAVRYDPAEASGIKLQEICVTTDKCVTRTLPDGAVVLNVEATKALLLSLAPQYIKPAHFGISAAVANTGSFEYRRDYDIGDIVTVQYKPYDITINRRIHRMTESYTETGMNIIPTLGEIMPKELE